MIRNLVPRGRGRVANVGERGHPFLSLQQDINRLFEDVWRGVPALLGSTAGPSLEVRDDEHRVLVVAELPGMQEGEVELELKEGVLTLKGEKKSETSGKTEAGVFSERWYGRFERSVEVGPVDEDKVSAEFKNGVLTVTLPKAEPAKEKARKIPIGKA